MINFTKKRIILGVTIAIFCIVLFILLTNNNPKVLRKKGEETVFVTVEKVKQNDTTLYAEAVGTVDAHASIAIKSLVDGELKSIGFNDGDFVKAGQVLFEIDNRPYLVKVRQSEANLAKDQTQLNLANVTLTRNRKLVEKGYIARQDYDQLLANREMLAATVKADQAALDDVKLQLSYCTIHAPISGRTGKTSVSVGNLVHASDQNPLVTINQINPIDIKFSLSEKYFQNIKAESAHGEVPVEAYLGGNTKIVKKGKLTFSDNTVDISTGMIQLTALFNNDDQYFWPGQFAKIKLPIDNLKGALLVPTRSISIGPEGPYVFVVNPSQTAEIKHVKVSAEINGETVITNGLTSGELVVTEGQLKLSDGAKVKYIN